MDMNIGLHASTPMDNLFKPREVTEIAKIGEHVYVMNSSPPGLQIYNHTGQFIASAAFELFVLDPGGLTALPEYNMLVLGDRHQHLPKLVFIQVYVSDEKVDFVVKKMKKLSYIPGAITFISRDNVNGPSLLISDPENNKIHIYSIQGKRLSSLTL